MRIRSLSGRARSDASDDQDSHRFTVTPQLVYVARMKPGDIVRLRSGGPLMTIEEQLSIDGVERVRCVWFQDESGGTVGGPWSIHRADFLPATLTPAN